MKDKIFDGFDPLVDKNSKVLILGSFPSVKSRENCFYYSNPQNRFWKVLSSIFNEKIPLTIDEKKELCRKHNIALWDVVVSSNLIGSADTTLEKSNFSLADIDTLLKNYPNIKKIACNGKLAFKLFQKHFAHLKIDAVYLPSTSPANTRFDMNIWVENLEINN